MKYDCESKISAIKKIQNLVREYLIGKYGINWKIIVNNNYPADKESLVYYYERKGIMDPWYDYCDDKDVIFNIQT